MPQDPVAPAKRIVQVTDIHLSRRFPLFLMNWDILAERINALAPDMVLVTGDLVLYDPDSEEDLDFAAEQLKKLKPRYRVIPGNHDIGETPYPGLSAGTHPQKPVTRERRERFVQRFGPDWWKEVQGDWLILGINAQIVGSGMTEDVEQKRFIETTLAGHRGSKVIVASHKAMYSVEEGADEPGWSIPEAESAWVQQQLARFETKVVLSGHLHREKRYRQAGIDCLWGPSTAFFSSHPRITKRRGHMRVGAVELTLDRNGFSANHLDDDRLINADARNWFNPGADAVNRIMAAPSPFADR